MIRVKKADLLAVADYLIGHLSYSQVPALAKRHKVEAKKDSASAQECRQTLPSVYGEAAKGRGRGTCRETRQKDEGGCQAEEPPDGIGRSP